MVSPAFRHAVVWLVAVAVVATAWVAGFADLVSYAERAQSTRYVAEHIATLAAAILAILAAFQLNGAPAKRRWAWLPVPPLVVWIATAGAACSESVRLGLHGDWTEGTECFGFLVVISAPLAVSLLILLYRAKPRAQALAAALAGLGVAALAAFLLQFFHPFATTIVDVAAHGAAIALVIAAAAWSPRLVPGR